MQADRQRRIAFAQRIWRETFDPRATLAEQYLNGRGLEIPDDLVLRVLRFHPRCPWDRDEKLPCLIAVLSADRRTRRRCAAGRDFAHRSKHGRPQDRQENVGAGRRRRHQTGCRRKRVAGLRHRRRFGNVPRRAGHRLAPDLVLGSRRRDQNISGAVWHRTRDRFRGQRPVRHRPNSGTRHVPGVGPMPDSKPKLSSRVVLVSIGRTPMDNMAPTPFLMPTAIVNGRTDSRSSSRHNGRA